MRISADRNDPSFNELYLKSKVMLDGVEIRNCITADDEAGECVCFVTDADGRLPPPDAKGNALTEVNRGVVKIMLPS